MIFKMPDEIGSFQALSRRVSRITLAPCGSIEKRGSVTLRSYRVGSDGRWSSKSYARRMPAQMYCGAVPDQP